MPVTGMVIGEIIIEGYETAVWPRASLTRKQTVTFTAKGWQAMGGAAGYSLAATKYMLKQVQELASNRDQQPTYIQWDATALPGAALNASDLHDGWYIIDDFEPDYQNYVVTGMVSCKMTVSLVAPAPPRRVSLAYTGGALASNFSGAALPLISLPVGSTALEASFSRVGAEGNIPCILSPVASPEPLVLSSTIANLFKGGVHVYDTINTGTYPVPTSGGTFVDSHWVEVFGTDHDFVGDCVITNGLLLILLQVGSAPTCYLWNTALAVATWQQCAILHADNADLVKAYSLIRIGPEECAVVATHGFNVASTALISYRLQRGRYEVRADLRPLVSALADVNALFLAFPATWKIAYNSTKIADNVLSEGTSTLATDYGYGAGFIASTTYPFIAGFLYQNEPGTYQPLANGNANLGLGDNTSLAINASRSYAFFAIPYGVAASSITPADLQSEAETGALGAGWSSVVDAAASNGHAAKCASGTTSPNANTFGPNKAMFQQALNGTYDLWFRVRVTSIAGSTGEMTLGLWDATSSSFLASTTYAANQASTSYVWLRAVTNTVQNTGDNIQFRAVTAATLATDWFIDEVVLVPKKLGNVNDGPQDIWQQFMFDRSVRLIRQ